MVLLNICVQLYEKESSESSCQYNLLDDMVLCTYNCKHNRNHWKHLLYSKTDLTRRSRDLTKRNLFCRAYQNFDNYNSIKLMFGLLPMVSNSTQNSTQKLTQNQTPIAQPHPQELSPKSQHSILVTHLEPISILPEAQPGSSVPNHSMPSW